MGRVKKKGYKSKWLPSILFLLPSLVGIIILILIPFMDVTRRSFISATNGNFIGLNNYREVIGNEAFRLAALNTIKFTFVCIPLLIIVSLFVAVAIYSLGEKTYFLKIGFLIPLAIPVASITLLWKIFFHRSGLINNFLGPNGIMIDWMNSNWSFWILVSTYIWKNLGYDMLLWLAGLSGISTSIYEAAAVDGANKMQIFLKITLPNLLTTLYTITVISFLNSFKVFREAYLISGNYPHEAIYLLQHIFNNWFISLDIDKLSAGAVMMATAIIVGIALLKKLWVKE